MNSYGISREPAGFSDNHDEREIPDSEPPSDTTRRFFFDADAATVFNNFMPTAMFKEAARTSLLAPNLQRVVAQSAFMRAALLDDRVNANQAANHSRFAYPSSESRCWLSTRRHT